MQFQINSLRDGWAKDSTTSYNADMMVMRGNELESGKSFSCSVQLSKEDFAEISKNMSKQLALVVECDDVFESESGWLSPDFEADIQFVGFQEREILNAPKRFSLRANKEQDINDFHEQGLEDNHEAFKHTSGLSF